LAEKQRENSKDDGKCFTLFFLCLRVVWSPTFLHDSHPDLPFVDTTEKFAVVWEQRAEAHGGWWWWEANGRGWRRRSRRRNPVQGRPFLHRLEGGFFQFQFKF
jgi:hypothetical protein